MFFQTLNCETQIYNQVADKEEFVHLHFQRDWFLNLISYWNLVPIGLDESLFMALAMPDTNNNMLMPKNSFALG
jgi:hypothetical protein